MNIVLIGMRGSGKSTIGMQLAEKLSWPFVETDTQIAEKMQLPIKKIVQKFGWEKFREQESLIIAQVSVLDSVIISTGGGVVLKSENTKLLKQNGAFIYLRASASTLFERIKYDRKRPILSDAKTLKEDIEKTLSIRENVYKESADFTVSTQDHTIEETIKIICTFLRERKII